MINEEQMEDHEKIFEDYLKTQGLKLTTQRRNILESAFAMHTHFDAEALLAHVQIAHSDVSRATVYRTLPLLIEAGLIRNSEKTKEKECYEHIIGHPKHFHILCTVCHKILEEEESQALLELIRETCEKNACEFQDYVLTIKGICNDCKK